MSRRSLILAGIVFVLLVQPSTATPPRYRVIDLDEGYASEVWAVNDAGRMAGGSTHAVSDRFEHACGWESGLLRWLEEPAAATDSHAVALLISGVVGLLAIRRQHACRVGAEEVDHDRKLCNPRIVLVREVAGPCAIARKQECSDSTSTFVLMKPN